MKILLFGASGQVGRACRDTLQQPGWELTTVGRKQADFVCPDQVTGWVQRSRPEFVINAAAYTDVEGAEKEPQLASMVNGECVGSLAAACASFNIPLIHLSTDFVFNGQASRAYREDDPVAPINTYGASKLKGERLLRAVHPQHICLRTSWVFSIYPGNFVSTMLRLAAQRTTVSVVGDQVGCPTYAGDIADVIAQLVLRYQQHEDLPWGLYHCSSPEPCSRYEFTRHIFAEAEAEGLLDPAPWVKKISSYQYPTLAARPAYGALDSSKLAQLLGQPLPHWNRGIRQICQTLASKTVPAAIPPVLN
ncbi:dTDP-4-dehydrorhamnose reductase [Microbulbifer aestuariivivens]|uniref:dTDP-4-dehydrorhamnose reductase n=1 Tax=Microbulbifer aestuariivivens TaxID=1908308 RepID=A0ABP9WRX6_9GAMM